MKKIKKIRTKTGAMLFLNATNIVKYTRFKQFSMDATDELINNLYEYWQGNNLSELFILSPGSYMLSIEPYLDYRFNSIILK